MIEQPVNDRMCLGQITDVVRTLIAAGDPMLLDLASRFSSTRELARWIRTLPQRDDDGVAGDGPKAAACSPPQRIRIPAPDPNCVERSALYLGVAEFIDSEPGRALVTVSTRAGRHTFPIEDDRPVVLDPGQTRNALDGAMFQLDRRRVEVTPNQAIDWMAAIAEEPATRSGNLRRVRNARLAMRNVMMGGSISPQSLIDIAYTVDKADQEAPQFGGRGRTLHYQTATQLVDAITVQRRRNAGLGLQLDSLRNAGLSSLFGDAVAALSKLHDQLGAQLAKAGINQKDLEKELIRKGLPAGATAIGGPAAGSAASVAADAIVAELFRNARGLRNASSWSVKTPGVILDEMKTTDQEIRALGADIWTTFRGPFAQQQKIAEQRFEQERGRKPGVGKDSDPVNDYAQVYAWMDPAPTRADVENKSYQGQFVYQWGEFSREWGEFLATHEHWYDRMWKGAYDKAIEFRERAVGWREQFQRLGGTPTTPTPIVPPDEPVPWKPILLVAGLGAAALVLPELLRTFRAGSAVA